MQDLLSSFELKEQNNNLIHYGYISIYNLAHTVEDINKMKIYNLYNQIIHNQDINKKWIDINHKNTSISPTLSMIFYQ
jgi:hypothetical protein